eukprot:1152603-Pelagomonas_calceolata.AAC.2
MKSNSGVNNGRQILDGMLFCLVRSPSPEYEREVYLGLVGLWQRPRDARVIMIVFVFNLKRHLWLSEVCAYIAAQNGHGVFVQV